MEIGGDIDSFIEAVSQSNTATYFHNLKFDGKFLLDRLMRNGFTHVPSNGRLENGTFKTLISDLGSFYTITVKWENGYTTEFRDSYKKLPMSVDDIPAAFGMDELGLSKGELDYTLPRPVGWRITPEEADYLKRDVLIVARAVGQQIANGMDRLTVGSDALREFTRLTGRDGFEKLFPVLSTSMDAEIRRAYRGGFTYADPRYSGRRLGAGAVFDVNSLYPSVMFDRPIPYGEPEYVSGRVQPSSRKPLTIQAVTFVAELKPGHVPCIQIKGMGIFNPTEYLERVDEPTTLMVTNVDLALMREHYDLTVLAWEGGWRFSAATGIFTEYIEKWMRVKAHSTGGMRTLSKLFLNSLYGKFATNPNVTGRYPVLDPEKNTVALKMGDFEERNPVYTAAGVFITSYARDVTIRAAQANYDTFAYADTDSLHLVGGGEPAGIRVHPSDLGAWKREYDFDAAYYIRAKQYFERETDGTYHNAVAGLPTYISGAMTFDDLTPGTVITVKDRGKTIIREHDPEMRNVLVQGKLTPRTVPGGVVLLDTPFELKITGEPLAGAGALSAGAV